MVYFILVLFAALVLFFVALYMVRNKPAFHRNISFNELDKYFIVLLKRGRNGGFMILELQKKKDLFLQFSKYIIDNKKRGLQLDFPVAQWSKPYYADFLKCVQRMDLKYQETTTSVDDPQNRVESFVTLDFGGDTITASRFAAMVFQDVFRAKQDDKLRLYYGNVDPRDIEI